MMIRWFMNISSRSLQFERTNLTHNSHRLSMEFLWPFFRLVFWYPIFRSNSEQLIWRTVTHRFHLRVPSRKQVTEIWLHANVPGDWFNIKIPSYQYRKYHCGDKTILRSSHLHNGISYTGKMTYLFWIRAHDNNPGNCCWVTCTPHTPQHPPNTPPQHPPTPNTPHPPPPPDTPTPRHPDTQSIPDVYICFWPGASQNDSEPILYLDQYWL